MDCCSSTTNSYGSWGSCQGACGTGTKYRTVTKKGIDGRNCGTWTDSTTCNTGINCCSSTWVSWGSWGSCSKSCGGGTQTKYGTKYSNYNGQSCGSTSTSQRCNTHSCCTIEYYGGRYCYNYFGASCYGNGCANTWVCKGYDTGCVAATNSACGKMGGTYFYFKRC